MYNGGSTFGILFFACLRGRDGGGVGSGSPGRVSQQRHYDQRTDTRRDVYTARPRTLETPSATSVHTHTSVHAPTPTEDRCGNVPSPAVTTTPEEGVLPPKQFLIPHKGSGSGFPRSFPVRLRPPPRVPSGRPSRVRPSRLDRHPTDGKVETLRKEGPGGKTTQTPRQIHPNPFPFLPRREIRRV